MVLDGFSMLSGVRWQRCVEAQRGTGSGQGTAKRLPNRLKSREAFENLFVFDLFFFVFLFFC